MDLKKIVAIDDCEDTLGLIQRTLQEFAEVSCLSGPDQALDLIRDVGPDLVILDVQMPLISGLDLCEQLRKTDGGESIPVVFLTSKGDVEDKLAGYETGADDYISKPFDIRELRMKIKAILRRVSSENDYKLGPFDLNTDRHELIVNANETITIPLTAIELKMMKFLFKNHGKILQRELFLSKIWNNLNVTNRTIDVHLSTIRKKHPLLKKCIQSIYGNGYRFSVQADMSSQDVA